MHIRTLSLLSFSFLTVVHGATLLAARHAAGLTPWLIEGAILLLVGGALLGLLFAQGHRALRTAAQLARVAEGELDGEIDEGGGEIGRVQRGLRALQGRLRREAEAAARAVLEQERLQAAIEQVSTNVMIADNDGFIRYMNHSVSAMLVNAEADVRKALPNFDAKRLLGVNFDVFHKNPAHQRNLLGQLRGVQSAAAALIANATARMPPRTYLRYITASTWLIANRQSLIAKLESRNSALLALGKPPRRVRQAFQSPTVRKERILAAIRRGR